MNPFNIVKNTIILNLEKQGYSIHDFEDALSNLNTGEGVLQVTKLAAIAGNPITDTINGATSLVGGTFLPVTMGAGGLLGLGVDAAEDGVRSQNKKLNELRRNIDIMKKMKNNLAIEHGFSKKD
jgi:hypothetical protein